MLPGNPQILTCPFCGSEKQIMSLMSGNTFGATYWSDNKRIAPMLPEISFVQKCPSCGKYMIKSRQEPKYAKEGFSMDTGSLSYVEAKEAFEQICKDGFLDLSEECSVRILLFHAYNDYYYRGSDDVQPENDDVELNKNNVLWLIKNWAKDDLLRAELYREISEFDKALELTNNYVPKDEFLKKILDEIIRRSKQSDSKVFEITGL